MVAPHSELSILELQLGWLMMDDGLLGVYGTSGGSKGSRMSLFLTTILDTTEVIWGSHESLAFAVNHYA